jgi:hypothetical protein
MPKEAVAGVVRVFNCDRDALGADRHNLGAVRILDRAGDPPPPENPITRAELRHSGLSLVKRRRDLGANDQAHPRRPLVRR